MGHVGRLIRETSRERKDHERRELVQEIYEMPSSRSLLGYLRSMNILHLHLPYILGCVCHHPLHILTQLGLVLGRPTEVRCRIEL